MPAAEPTAGTSYIGPAGRQSLLASFELSEVGRGELIALVACWHVQLWRVLEVYPGGRLVNGNTGAGIYKEEALKATQGPAPVLISLQDVTELQGWTVADGSLGKAQERRH